MNHFTTNSTSPMIYVNTSTSKMPNANGVSVTNSEKKPNQPKNRQGETNMKDKKSTVTGTLFYILHKIYTKVMYFI